MDDQSRINELWERYQREPERAVRDELILHYSPLVKYVANRGLTFIENTQCGLDSVAAM